MQNYGETSDPKTGKKGYMRINSRAGETITISNVNFSSGGTAELKAAVSLNLFVIFTKVPLCAASSTTSEISMTKNSVLFLFLLKFSCTAFYILKEY